MLAATVASLVVAAVGTVASISEQRKARKSQAEANAKQQRLQQIQAQKQQQQQLREQQIRRSQILAAGASQGVASSSGVSGGMSAVSTQTASNISFQNQVTGIQSSIANSLQSAANAQYRSSAYQGMANLGVSAFSAMGGSFSSFSSNNASTGIDKVSAGSLAR